MNSGSQCPKCEQWLTDRSRCINCGWKQAESRTVPVEEIVQIICMNDFPFVRLPSDDTLEAIQNLAETMLAANIEEDIIECQVGMLVRALYKNFTK